MLATHHGASTKPIPSHEARSGCVVGVRGVHLLLAVDEFQVGDGALVMLRRRVANCVLLGGLVRAGERSVRAFFCGIVRSFDVFPGETATDAADVEAVDESGLEAADSPDVLVAVFIGG